MELTPSIMVEEQTQQRNYGNSILNIYHELMAGSGEVEVNVLLMPKPMDLLLQRNDSERESLDTIIYRKELAGWQERGGCTTLTSSYIQSDQGYSNCNIGVVRPSTSKSTQRKSGERDSFTVSLPPGSKRKEISDLEKIKIVDEAYTSMKAQQQSGKIRSENLIILSISICKAVPQLYDKPPPSSECSSEDFIYWGTVYKLLREFHRKERAADQARKEVMGTKRK